MLSGFGLEMVEWMISRGANNIVLSSRSGISTGYQSFCLRKWHKRGINVVISTHDASSMEGAEHLIDKASDLLPIGGIFNLAIVLHDALIENLDESHFEEVFLPKVHITKNLDSLSRNKCLQLDYFVGFSSYTSGRGIAGQSNYGMANFALEEIIRKRHEAGLPGLAVQWGLIKDVGLAAGKLYYCSRFTATFAILKYNFFFLLML